MKKEMKNKPIFKLVIISLLSAIGVILMSFIQFEWPLFPYLNVEISDFVVIFAFLLFGAKEATIVAVLKTSIDLIFNMDKGGQIPVVGHITALIASLSYVVVLWVLNKIIKKDNFGVKLAKYSISVLIVSIFMTLANYAILTPLFLEGFDGGIKWFGIGLNTDTLSFLGNYSGTNDFFLSVVAIMLPFNLVKGVLITVVLLSAGEIILAIYRKKLRLNQEKEDSLKVLDEQIATLESEEKSSEDMTLDDMFK